MQKSRILITAAGSIGERHIRNLWQLGFRDIVVYRTRNLPFRDLGSAQVSVVLDWQKALSCGAEIAFVTSPTHLHIEQTLDCLRANMHVFVEKPIAHNLSREAELYSVLEESKKVLQVGYMLEFHPLLQIMKRYCDNQTFGRILKAESYWGEYLPNWHPWEDYRESYAALAAMGGGVALTLSHEIDTILWLLNSTPSKWFTVKNTLNTLPIKADNLTEVLMQFGEDAMARIHMNYIEKKAKRVTELLFENGRLTFYYFDNKLVIEDFSKDIAETIDCKGFERNDLFISEVKEFLNRIVAHQVGVDKSLKRAFEIVKICSENE